MSKITIAIDGFSSCGKSTLAKSLAVRLGYSYIDTGAMYRAVAFYCLRHGLIKDGKPDVPGIINALNDITISFQFNTATKSSETYLNGENVEKEIRGMEVSEVVSTIAAIHEVREKLVNLQRVMGRGKGVVMDGRDIGTNVFPHAELKLFMTADKEVRIQRRLDELSSKGELVSYNDLSKNIEERDYQDTHRKENPLIKAKDAILLDNSDINKEQQLDYVLKLINDLLLTKD